jgi:hypothetical protein
MKPDRRLRTLASRLLVCAAVVTAVTGCRGRGGARGATPSSSASSAKEVAPPVHTLDLGALSPTAFADDELDVPFYLAHLSEVANSIALDGPLRGYIALPVWRQPSAPHNARVMESLLSLAWFYTTDRPWNSYRHDPALRARIEAALEFWCTEQAVDGTFSEYALNERGLPPTAFATKFVGEALRLLSRDATLDPALLHRALGADRRAVSAVLTDPGFFAAGRSFSNQYDNIWGGALTYLGLAPETELERRFESRFASTSGDFQSPAGYYYESDGPDFGYTLNTHGPSARQAWDLLQNGPFATDFLNREQAWFGWLAMNALPEPKGGFTLNAALQTRQKLYYFADYDTSLASRIPLARAFARSVDELAAARARARENLADIWPRVEPLRVPDVESFSPYVFLNRLHPAYYPSASERDEARRLLPVLASENFTERRADTRKQVSYTFVRRPTYYATFAQGEICSTHQRYGLGLVWNDALGVVLQSQPDSDVAAWGTQAEGAPRTFESASLIAEFKLAGRPLETGSKGVERLTPAPLEAAYPLGTDGSKSLRFDERGVTITVLYPGSFSEILPLLVAADAELDKQPGKVTLATPAGALSVTFDGATRTNLVEPGGKVGSKRVVVLQLAAAKRLSYSLRFTSAVRR